MEGGECVDWAQLVSTLGFPIVLCGAMAFFIKYLIDKYTAMIENQNEMHKQEMTEMRTAIENNTIAMTKLVEKFSGGGEG